jgi:hypothetical protein
LKLELGVNNSLVSNSEKEDAIASSNGVCQFCGFKADKFQEAIKYAGQNVAACSFCFQTLNLFACSSRRAGYLIYLPEFSQIELNHMLRALYVARTDVDPKISDKARKAFDVISARRKVATDILGTDDPKILADIMYSFMNEYEKSNISSKLSGIRLLSLDKKIEVEDGMEFNEFPQMLNFWKSSVDFLNQPCSNWQKIEVVDEKIENVADEVLASEEVTETESVAAEGVNVEEVSNKDNEEEVNA